MYPVAIADTSVQLHRLHSCMASSAIAGPSSRLPCYTCPADPAPASVPLSQASRCMTRAQQSAAGRSQQPLCRLPMSTGPWLGRRAARLAQPPAQVAVAGGHDVALVLPHALADAVVRVRAGVRAGQPLHARVLARARPRRRRRIRTRALGCRAYTDTNVCRGHGTNASCAICTTPLCTEGRAWGSLAAGRRPATAESLRHMAPRGRLPVRGRASGARALATLSATR